MARIPTNIAEHVGRTPMVELTRVAGGLEVELFAKLEAFNPGGSVKDRIGVAMIGAAARAAVRVRGQGIRPRAHAPARHEPRARGPPALVRGEGRADGLAWRHDG